jgi:hypothetical protein
MEIKQVLMKKEDNKGKKIVKIENVSLVFTLHAVYFLIRRYYYMYFFFYPTLYVFMTIYV